MPRLCNSGEAVDKWCEETSEPSSTYDVCADCAHDNMGEALVNIEVIPDTDRTGNYVHLQSQVDPNEPLGTLEDEGCDHPCYESLHAEGNPYRCDICGKKLRLHDNGKNAC